MEPLYNFVSKYQNGPKCLGVVIAIAGITVVLSALCAWILIPLDRKRIASNVIIAIGEDSEIPVIKLKDALHFKLELWLIILICFLFYSTQFPFISLSKTYLMGKYGWSASETSLQQSLFFFAAVVSSPIFGKLVDLSGYNIIWVIISLLMSLTAHCLFMLTFLNSYVPILLLGMSLSLSYASLWPMASLIVPKNQLGTAYGM